MEPDMEKPAGEDAPAEMEKSWSWKSPQKEKERKAKKEKKEKKEKKHEKEQVDVEELAKKEHKAKKEKKEKKHKSDNKEEERLAQLRAEKDEQKVTQALQAPSPNLEPMSDSESDGVEVKRKRRGSIDLSSLFKSK